MGMRSDDDGTGTRRLQVVEDGGSDSTLLGLELVETTTTTLYIDEQVDRDRLLSQVSQELRSPLAVVHQFTALLLDGAGGPVNPEQTELLEVVLRNVNQLTMLVDDLVQTVRSQGGRVWIDPHATQLAPLLGELIASCTPRAVASGVTLVVTQDRLPDVVADPRRVREVLANLLDDALLFTPAGGMVTVGAVGHGDMVRVTVRDTGGSRDGLSLGLSVSRDLVQRQGGSMWAERLAEPGAAISFTLPSAARHTPERATAPAPSSPRFLSRTATSTCAAG